MASGRAAPQKTWNRPGKINFSAVHAGCTAGTSLRTRTWRRSREIATRGCSQLCRRGEGVEGTGDATRRVRGQHKPQEWSAHLQPKSRNVNRYFSFSRRNGAVS
jgi:hypothetical protein